MNRIPVFVGVSLLVSLTLGHVALSNAQTPAVAPVGALALPRETAILAKLATNLEPQRCKPGDSVEAQTTEDIKQGKEVLLKKESVLLGHVSVVEPPSATQLETMVGIIFDGVKTKKGPGQSVHLLIRALAPEAEGPENSTLSEGRGMPGATTAATVPGKVSAAGTAGGRLTALSIGVSGFPGVRLENRKEANGQVMTIIAISEPGVKFKKGTQLVLKVAGQ
jgi:hypothetical protein